MINLFNFLIDPQLVRFLIVGLLVFLFYSGLLYFFLNVLGIHYFLGFSLAYFIAVSTHFVLTRLYTFQIKSGDLNKEISKYLLVLIINYSINMGVIFFMVHFLMTSSFFGAVFGIICTTLTGFFFSKLWIFKK